MKNKVFLGLGLVLLLGGALVLLFGEGLGLPFGNAVPYIYLPLAVGWVFTVYGLGDIVSRRVAKTQPETARRVAIEQADERNIALSNKAKAKAYDRMLYIFSALVVVLAVTGAGVWAVLLCVAAYILVVCINIYYLARYQKEE